MLPPECRHPKRGPSKSKCTAILRLNTSNGSCPRIVSEPSHSTAVCFSTSTSPSQAENRTVTAVAVGRRSKDGCNSSFVLPENPVKQTIRLNGIRDVLPERSTQRLVSNDRRASGCVLLCQPILVRNNESARFRDLLGFL